MNGEEGSARFLAQLDALTDADLARRGAKAAHSGMTVRRGIARVLLHEAKHVAGLETLLCFEWLEVDGRGEAAMLPVEHISATSERA